MKATASSKRKRSKGAIGLKTVAEIIEEAGFTSSGVEKLAKFVDIIKEEIDNWIQENPADED